MQVGALACLPPVTRVFPAAGDPRRPMNVECRNVRLEPRSAPRDQQGQISACRRTTGVDAP
jgi:hypothetical protein